MKKLVLFLFSIALIGCSVQEKDSISGDMDIESFDSMVSVDGCSVHILNFENEGTIEFRNFYDYIEVSILNIGTKDLNSINIHFTDDNTTFPKTGKGELNPSKFFFSTNIYKGVEEVTYQFSFEELGVSTGDILYIASVAEFGSGKNKTEIIAKDETLTGAEYYFEYFVEEFKNYAGSDQIREISLSEAIAVPSWDEVRKLYANMLDSGVPKKAGVYSPTIWDIINDFNDPNRETQLGEYTTTYTLGTGECSDSVELTLRIIPDSL